MFLYQIENRLKQLAALRRAKRNRKMDPQTSTDKKPKTTKTIGVEVDQALYLKLQALQQKMGPKATLKGALLAAAQAGIDSALRG